MKYKPNKTELFAKNSSLAISVYKDKKHDFDFHIYDRRTNRIVYKGEIPLVTLGNFMDLEPIKKIKKKRAYVPVSMRNND